MATTNKYDRQLRLWGSTGQKLLSESVVILVNTSTSGTETLKNLVLPGIGSFHIIDDVVVPAAGNNGSLETKPFTNFFVVPPMEETPRARIATEYLSELNPDVRGTFTHVSSLANVHLGEIMEDVVRKNGNGRVLVIGADLPPLISKRLSQVCWDSEFPLLLVKSYGLIGSVRVQTSYHPIIESKPDNTKPDLRLAQEDIKFPELHQYAKSINLNQLDNQEHGHVPYVVILLKALDQWRHAFAKGESSKIPKTLDEKSSFRQIIKSMSRNWNNEVNFQEADENAYLAYTVEELPFEMQDLLFRAEERIKSKKSSLGSVTAFDVLLVSLKRFIDHQERLPLNGSIPDMTSSTELYISLQSLYKKKAEEDKEYIQDIVQNVLNELYDDSDESVRISMSNDDVGTLCKNVFNIRLIQTRSFFDEFTSKFSNDDEKEEIVEDIISLAYESYEVPSHTPLLWYISLRACDSFYEKHGYYPGKDERALAQESDACELQRHIEVIVKTLSLEDNHFMRTTLLSSDEETRMAHAREMTRYFNADIHNIASVIGGVASQEAVKLITSQYIPINSTYIYNGIASVGGVIRV